MTIRDVARHANVGIATVSRVLNGHPSVRETTRLRVLAAIEELEFSPNTAAQMLSSGQTYAIGVFVPYFTRPAFVQRLIGIQQILDDSDYDLVLYNTSLAEKYCENLKQVVRQRRVDGILVVSMSVSDEDRLLMEKMNIPLVLIETESDVASCVRIDNIFGGRLATEHLLSLGHRVIAFLGDQRDSPFGFSASNERYMGYRYALSEANIELPSVYSSFSTLAEHSQQKAIEQAQHLLLLPEPPTAIFAASDTQAFGVLEAARHMGYQVPDQLSVIGFDDIELASYLNLTTIRQPMIESGRHGASLLLKHLRGVETSRHEELLELEIIVRGSTASPVSQG